MSVTKLLSSTTTTRINSIQNVTYYRLLCSVVTWIPESAKYTFKSSSKLNRQQTVRLHHVTNHKSLQKCHRKSIITVCEKNTGHHVRTFILQHLFQLKK